MNKIIKKGYFRKGTVQNVEGKLKITYFKNKGVSSILYIKTHEIIPEQQEEAKSLINKEVDFRIQNNFAVLNI